MIGYGPEDNHFVAELTYNYGIKSYKLGNDFMGITLKSDSIIDKAKKHDWPVKEENDLKFVEAPGGYRYFIVDEVQLDDSDPVKKVTLACSNLQKSTEFWCDILNMKKYGEEDNSVILGYSEEQCKLELREIGKPVNHEQAFGRIAFSCPTDELAGIQEQVKTAGCKILTPLISLDTPGKATVHVVILADPDGHEICFVGDEAFRELSKVDPKAEGLLNDAIAADKSDEWFAKKGKSKVEM
ncbi:glyoxalase domain-containing protein 4-like isoform X3 [Stegodyphus dumicola]|nr:glyoxalase domain-containing protein 4-like isoform X3 [Stegodyphus dumicola]XP_035210577.1 glyoxalase domain-containing protein 4-like isoform X3 [Stegodyphus dumicola]